MMKKNINKYLVNSDLKFKALMLITIVIWFAISLIIIIIILYRGASVFSYDFFFNFPSSDIKTFGVFPSIIGTLITTIISIAVFFPIGVFSGYFISDYIKNYKIQKLILNFFYLAASVPTVIYGLFGFGFFVLTFGKTLDKILETGVIFGQPIILWASIAIGMISLPTTIISSFTLFSRTDAEKKEIIYSLGGSKSDVFFYAMFSELKKDLISLGLLSFSRSIGETAPILYLGAAYYLPNLPIVDLNLYFFSIPIANPFDQFMHLGYQIFTLTVQAPDQKAFEDITFGIAAILIGFIIIINLISNFFYLKYFKKFNYENYKDIF